MDTKKLCKKCGIIKSANFFWKETKRKGGLSYLCIECSKKRLHLRYKKFGDIIREKQRIRNNILRTKNRKLMIELLNNRKCIDCGESNIQVLEFDHIRGKKKDKVARILVDYAWPLVLKEIKKCEIVCSNCHRIRTESRIKSYRFKFFTEILRGDEFKDLAFTKLLQSKCKDCGESNGIVLDYDHIDRKTKSAKIADIIRRRGYTIGELQREINKCEIRCANCHRLRTNTQLGSYKI